MNLINECECIWSTGDFHGAIVQKLWENHYTSTRTKLCVIWYIIGFESLPSHKRRLTDLRRPLPVSILQTRGVTGPSWSLWAAEEPVGGEYHWHVQTRVQQVRLDQDARMCAVSCLLELPVSDPEGSEQRASSLLVRMLKWMTGHFTFCMSFPFHWWFPS